MQAILKTENIEAVKRKLEEVENNITDTTPLMSEILNYPYNVSKDSFDDEKNPRGYTRTSPPELIKKYKSTSKILYKDGNMQRGLINDSDDNSAIVGITTVNEDDHFYPMVHQFGVNNAGRNKKIRIPQRGSMPITFDGEIYSDVNDRIEEISIEFIESDLE